MSHIKRVLGIGRRTKPVTLQSVTASEQDPAMKRKSLEATNKMVTEVMRAERKSWEVRQMLANGALDLVIRSNHDQRQ